MTDLESSVIESIKGFLLPELRKLQEGQNEIRIRLETVEKQMVIMNENISNNSRRIDDINKRIDGVLYGIYSKFDDVNKRFDDVNSKFDRVNMRFDGVNIRIDGVYIELGNMKKEMERLKRDEAITGDILHRMEILEEKVLLGR